MKKQLSILGMLLAGGLWAGTCAAYNSGSTGVDGAFNPTTSQSVALPPDGIFNYTSVNIPAGVTISYIRNAANTPVTILTTGDVTIAGTINVSGSGNPNPADIAGAGVGGPGGYNGGRGGQQAGITANWVNGYAGLNVGRAGVGPGGGSPGSVRIPASPWFSAGYAELSGGGPGAYSSSTAISGYFCPVAPGVTYGNTTLMPLVGGSGGGGGAGGAMTQGSGGAGGGGAILIAASGTLNVTGTLLANGGNPTAPSTADGHGSTGGTGSGGAIRLIASTVSGNGNISAVGGNAGGDNFATSTYGSYGGCSSYNSSLYLTGGLGRIRIEYDTLLRTTPTNPAWLGGAPGLTFVPGLPSLRIDSIVTNLGTITVPLNPTGNGDIIIPTGFTNPVTANFVTTGVTVGSTIVLTVMPASGPAYNAANTAITVGTTNSATGSIAFNLSSGSVTVQAKVTYTVVASVGDAMSIYAQGERVEKITLASTLGAKESTVTLITVSGKEYVVPAGVLAAIPV